MRFTPEQEAAIKIREGNLLVAAGAGSGKTGVLTQRIVERLGEGEDIDRLLVLTYTKAAAGEMLKRIREKIFQAAAQSKTQEERRHWQRQIMLLGDAPITTLHSFCLQLLKRHYNAIPGLDPNFRILEPSMALVHLHDLLDDFLEGCYTRENQEDRERFFSLLRLYGNRLGDDGLKDEILRLREFGSAQGDFYQWLLESLEKYENKDFWFDTAMSMGEKEVRLVIKALMGIREEAQALNGPQGYMATLDKDIAGFQHLLNEDWHWTSIGRGKFFGTLARKTKDDDEDIANYLKARRNSVKDYFNKKIQPLFKRDFHSYGEEMDISAKDMGTLIEITSEFYKEYQAYKIKKGFLEFSDLEEYAYVLLRDNPHIREEYHRVFKEILIDEYQDVNPLQEKILSLLTNGNNLFVVGDIKQSIYGFRFADHTIFKSRYDKYQKDTGNQCGTKILLNRNFRSGKGILDAVNYFFCQWMDEATVDLAYGEDEALIPGIESEYEAEPAVEVNFIYRPSDEDMAPGFDDPEEMRYHGRYIAKQIAAMVDRGDMIKCRGVERPVTYGDFAILMRALQGTAPIIEDELLNLGIPVTGPNKRRFTQCQEVRILLSLLRVLDNPLQDIPLSSLLRSPFFLFDENQLMEIALCQPKKRLWQRLEEYIDINHGGELAVKAQSFRDKILAWRNMSKIYPVGDLLPIIMEELNYTSFWSGLPGGRKRLDNIEIFIDKAQSFQETGGGLFDFLRYVDNLAKTGADEVDDSEGGENTVKIMSIHRSKGLEFPIVFCPAMEKTFNNRDSGYPLLLHNSLGLGPKYKNYERRTISPTLPRLLIKHTINRANVGERLRLLYVAMTRAESKLIFTAAVNSQAKPRELMEKAKYSVGPKLPGDMMVTASSFLQWLCQGLSRKNSGEKLPYNDCPIKISVTPADNPLEVVTRGKEGIPLPEGALENLEKAMAVTKQVPVRAKVSVTDLLPKEEKFGSPISHVKPKFLGDIRQLTAAERGTIFHRFMELLEHQRPWDLDSLKKEAEKMTQAGIFTPQEAETLDIEAAAAFYQSQYGRELRRTLSLKKELAFTAVLPAREILNLDTEEKTVVQGAVDMVYRREDGGWVLIDYKTGSLGGGGDDDFLRHYAKQMELYALALDHLYHIEIEESVFFLTQERRFLRYK